MSEFSFDLEEVQLTKNIPGVFSQIAYMKIPAGGKLFFPTDTRAVIKLYGKDANGNIVELDKKDELYIAYKLPADRFLKPLTEIVRYRPFSSLTEQEQRDIRKTPHIKFDKETLQKLSAGADGVVFGQDAEIVVLLKSDYTLALDTIDEVSKQVFELLDVEYQ